MPNKALTVSSHHHQHDALEPVPDADEETIKGLWACVSAYRASKAGIATRTLTVKPDEADGGEEQGEDEDEDEDEDEVDDEDEEDDQNSIDLSLVGLDRDPLIPSSAQINEVWSRGRATWMALVAKAEEGWPTWLVDPSIMLKDIPSLPRKIRKHRLSGRPVWRVPDVNQTAKEVRGADKYFPLSIEAPIQCRMCDEPSSSDKTRTPEPTAPRGLAILVLCWSYILSARLLELQDRRIKYSRNYLQPKADIDIRPSPGQVVLHLPAAASPRLVRWLCALLSPQPGWEPENDNEFPMWAAFCSGDVGFVISTPTGGSMSMKKERAPTSKEARGLLVEFCCLYGLGPKLHGKTEFMLPYTAAFLAALVLPYYQYVRLQPQLPVPFLAYSGYYGPPQYDIYKSVKHLYDDMPYYMTLSLHPPSISSMIWSIFWQPSIECNLVSPWLSSILSVIRPIIDARDFGRLARIFAHRRPRVSLVWLGIFLLGDITILSRMVRYLETLEEDVCLYGIGLPDLSVAAWTGSPLSFWDEAEDGEALATDADARATSVSRAEVLRRRLNFRLGDNYSTLFAWRPFGSIPDRDIEPDLREYMDQRNFREYVYWTWLGVSDTTRHQEGFRRDTGRFIEDVPDNLDLLDAAVEDAALAKPHSIKRAASKRTTLAMLDFSVEDVRHDRSLDIAAIPGLTKNHEWLIGWRGFG
ncbi:hypothetical protein F5Y12DRAFT_618008 [Xylaria sp. FL1777]|nr:hypothetical protein F5Y12DRAFT_618008 [Xylaria sp. FL1777]